METIARNTPQLTPATPASVASPSLARKCGAFTLRALRAAGRAYVEGARCNPYWIGTYWFPRAPYQSPRDSR